MAIALASLFLLMDIRDADAEVWALEIRQTLEDKTNSVTMSCSDEERELCRGDINLSLGGRDQAVSVIALIRPGNVFVKFRVGDVYLFVGSQPYVHIPIGRRGSIVSGETILLSEPPPLAGEDSPNSLYHRPVLRKSQALATVQIEIHPGR